MQTMNISLPDPLKNFVDHQIAEGRYSSVSEYIRELRRYPQASPGATQAPQKQGLTVPAIHKRASAKRQLLEH